VPGERGARGSRQGLADRPHGRAHRLGDRLIDHARGRRLTAVTKRTTRILPHRNTATVGDAQGGAESELGARVSPYARGA
jgi:hypothetical protein